MALPVLSKTWQFSVNNVVTWQVDASTTLKKLIFQFKAILLALPLAPWVVVSSSDSSTAGASDKWLTYANCVAGSGSGNARAWIVLRNSVTNVQLLMDMNGNGNSPNPLESGMTWVMSPAAGFTGGSTTARPTATDEILITAVTGNGNNAGFFLYYNSSTPQQVVLNVMQSTDGQCLRWIMFANGLSRHFGILDFLAEAVSGFTNPVFMNVSSTGGVEPGYGNTLNTTTTLFRKGATVYGGNWTAEGIRSQNMPENSISIVPNEYDGTWPMYPAGFMGSTTNTRGRLGRFYDIWFGASVLGEGFCYPNDGTRQFLQVGGVIVPWNGSLPQIA